MPNLAVVLKQEIARLARKEVRNGTGTTRSAAAQHRRDIAELKRQVRDLTRQVAFLESQERRRAKDGAPSEEQAEGRRFSVGGLKTHRRKLGLSAAEYGKLIGVSGQTVYAWEQERSRPRAQQLAALVTIRGIGKREAKRRLALLES